MYVWKKSHNSRGIGLEAVSDTGDQEATAEAVEEDVLPTLLLVLLSGLDAEQPAGRRVVLGAVRGRGAGGGGELPPDLGRGDRRLLILMLDGAASGRPHGAVAEADGGHGVLCICMCVRVYVCVKAMITACRSRRGRMNDG